MVRKGEGTYVIDASATPVTDLSKNAVNLSKWTFSFDPKEEWRQMFIEAWRLERDFFYDPGMQGVDYEKTLDRYLPLVDRVRNRDELNDLIGQVVGELSALHTFVFGGDVRKESQQVAVASLGAELVRDTKAGGYEIAHIYRADPNYLDNVSPLAASGLRYGEWENTRRLSVDKESGRRIGYVHLRAMGGGDYTDWAKNFYPVFDRDGLMIDVRHNNGGNIDSWILEKLLTVKQGRHREKLVSFLGVF